MDRFTETYIEMVSKAKEIQKLCKYNKGDWFIGTFAFYHSEKPKPKVFYKSGLGSFDPREHSWLPTLEDLFGMLDIRNFISIGQNIKTHEAEKYVEIPYKYYDMKENLINIIMKSKFNKSWNPNKKEWEEINEM